MDKEKKFLAHKAYNIRVSSLRMTTTAGSGHPTSALSAADIVSVLFFHAMHYDPKQPNIPENDRFILSKGHASPVLYAVYKELGILTEKDLLGYRKIDSPLEGHPTLRFDYTQAATGSLGMGLSIGIGMAIAAKMRTYAYHTFVLMGDSEITEGAIWEAAEIAAYYKLDNLVGIVDCNRLGQRGETIHGHQLQRYEDKFKAFGWEPFIVDGHDVYQLIHALDKAREQTERPVVILAKTYKGYGVERVQDKKGYHGKAFKKDELNTILTNLAEEFPDDAAYNQYEHDFAWHPKLPEDAAHEECNDQLPTVFTTTESAVSYSTDEMVATRKAYGSALRMLGDESNVVVALDAEVSNSTYSELFAEKHPDRFIECFIAEQNMVSMGVGLDYCARIPFISTFAAFLTRAHDQVRMAAIGWARLRIAGSHAGVSIGQDGPSQMGLEDLAMMRALPNSVVLYPSDAVSTHKLVAKMAAYQDGISYIRTTRMATPVLYDTTQTFSIGGCAVMRKSDNDQVCIIGAGVTLHEALKAYDILEKEGVSVSVIDLYSVKPLDVETISKEGSAARNHIITVEDHYLQGGLGEAVSSAISDTDIHVDSLAVTALPRSGKPEELLAWAGIDAQAIVDTVTAWL